MSKEEAYTIERESEKLTFTTTSFRAEKSSVLHEGVYSPEFSSIMLASAAAAGIYAAGEYFNISSIIFRLLLALIIFILAFWISVQYVFRKRHLKAVFDKSCNELSLTIPGFITTTHEKIALNQINDIAMETKTLVHENPDGIAFVQRIAKQHGGAVPGLRDPAEFNTPSLKLEDGAERIILAVKSD
ncbi:hypothetical protein H8E50_04165 [bacterium]|nr:hypothetical protein [bacterium]